MRSTQNANQDAATLMLTQVSEVNDASAGALMEVVYDELRDLAAALLSRERPDHTLQPTALVHEAYMKLIDQSRVEWRNKSHFFAIAAQAIRRILIDHARTKNRAKRGGDRQRLTMTTIVDQSKFDDVDLIGLDDALESLTQLNERHAKVVEMRFFGGMNVQETAAVLGVSEKTIKNDWRAARAWLRVQLGDDVS